MILKEEQTARVNQRGPLWGKYESEFVKEQKIQSIRGFKEEFYQKISNFLKR